MIVLIKKCKEGVSSAVEMFESMRKQHESGQCVVYTTPPCVIKAALLSDETRENFNLVNENYIIVVDLAIWNNKRKAVNDSPGTKPTTVEESNENISRIIRELEGIPIG